MHYVSTRDAAHATGLGEAIARGLAPDGGLYVPETLPRVDAAATRQIRPTCRRSPSSLLRPFAAGDVAGARGSPRSPATPSTSRRRVVEVDGRRRAAVGARAVPRPDRGLQGLRRALSRGDARAHPARRTRAGSPSWSRPRATPVARSRRRSTAARGWTSWCCTRAGSSRRARRSSSPAGAATCARCRSPAPSTTASAW